MEMKRPVWTKFWVRIVITGRLQPVVLANFDFVPPPQSISFYLPIFPLQFQFQYIAWTSLTPGQAITVPLSVMTLGLRLV